jgi:predicted enzyme related to lactoylglutathione lyase
MADLFQVIVVANNPAKLAEFYSDVLGFEVTYPPNADDLSSETWIELNAGSAKLAIHGGGEIKTSGSIILSVKVDDIEFARFDLEQRGIDHEPIFEVSPGVRSVKLRDPEGNRISLEQHS